MEKYSLSKWGFDHTSKICVLTGAGISADSGVKTFRDAGGLWEGHHIEDVATPEGFYKDPTLVIDFYNQRRKQLVEVEPNPAHEALARLEKKLGEDKCLIVTQNVDDLHERGGSRNIIHMHGELRKLRCMDDDSHIIEFSESQNQDTHCPKCSAKMRPHIVWFGEIPFEMDKIEKSISDCTHFVFIGTSSLVYPAAGYKNMAKHCGAKVLNINLSVDRADLDTHYYIEGRAKVAVSEWVDELLDYL